MKKPWIFSIATVALLIPGVQSEMKGEVSQSMRPGVVVQGSDVTYLNENKEWTKEVRQRFYHKEQGTRLIPYSWFEALEVVSGKPPQANCQGGEPFRANENLIRYGLLADPNLMSNPYRLPVGFTTSEVSEEHPLGKISKKWFGFTCAACHTGQMTYKGRTFRIDGGPAMLDIRKLTGGMLDALRVTLGITPDTPPKMNERFTCFARKVLKNENPSVEEQQKLFQFVAQVVERSEELDIGKIDGSNWSETSKKKIMRKNEIFPIEWGFGRLDALGRGGNTVLTQLDESNRRAANAPVNFPQLWGAWEYDWVQWNGSIENAMARNLAQVISVTRRLTFEDKDDPYKSDVDLNGINELEGLIKKLTPPRWPKEFPPIDTEKSQRGEALYGRLCAHCHVPKPIQEYNGSGQHLAVNTIPLEEIGTDPTHAFNFYARMVNTGGLGGRVGKGRMSSGELMEYMTTEMMKRDKHNLKDLNVNKNRWRAPLAYMARPHRAIWSTAPFLHNGSVPNLYQLLLPAEQRQACFHVGNLEFDPKDIGFLTGKCKVDGGVEIQGVVEFNANLPGNSNAGHEFRNVEGCQDFITKGGRNGVLGCELRDEDRWAIIEYLKTL